MTPRSKAKVAGPKPTVLRARYFGLSNCDGTANEQPCLRIVDDRLGPVSAFRYK